MASLVQPSFTGGEISPEIYPRIDIAKYGTALKTCLNMFVQSQGGVSNRAGTELIAPVKDSSKATRLIPFQFNTTQAYILEFGHLYMRVMKDGATVLESAQTITAGDTGAGRIIEIVGHGYSNGDTVFITGTGTDLDNRFWLVADKTTDGFALEDIYTGAYAPAGVAAAAGTAARVYEITTLYDSDDLFNIRYVQDADVMNLTHGDYVEQKLSRAGHNDWTLEAVDRTISVTAPANLAAAYSVSNENDPMQSYLITAVHAGGETGGFGPVNVRYDIGEEGTRRDTDATVILNWTESADATSYRIFRRQNVVTSGFTIGSYYEIGTVAAGTSTFTDLPSPADSTKVVPSASGGAIDPITNFSGYTTTPPSDDDILRYVVTAIDADTLEESLPSTVLEVEATLSKAGSKVTLTWDAVANIDSYKVYKEQSVGSGLYGYIGTAYEEKFTDNNITPDFDTPPKGVNPFDGAGEYPISVTYHKNRRVYGGTNNRPQTFFGSRSGNYNNMNVSTPARDDDAYTYTIASQQVNAIRQMVSLKSLLIFTTGAEFVATGGADSNNITPSNIDVDKESGYGCSDVPPLVIGNNVLFAESTDPTAAFDVGSSVREFGYEFSSDGYQGNDRTILAKHLFEVWGIKSWAYAKKPSNIIWAVREDGVLCAMTYLIEHDVWGWHRHETDGDIEDVAVIREGRRDAVYFIVKREINGQTIRFIERMADRSCCNIEDAFFVDCGLTYDGLREGLEVLTLSGSVWDGSAVLTLSASTAVFNSGMIGKKIFMYARNRRTRGYENLTRVRVTGYVNTTQILVEPLQEVPEAMRGADISIWGVGVESITNLHHLEGKTVSVLADGNVQIQKVVTNGSIALDEAAAKVHVGLPYTSIFQSLAIAVQPTNSDNTISKSINVGEVEIMTRRTRAFEVGPSLDRMRFVKVRYLEDWGNPTALYDGMVDIKTAPSWNDGSFYIRQSAPVPTTISMIIPDIEVSD